MTPLLTSTHHARQESSPPHDQAAPPQTPATARPASRRASATGGAGPPSQCFHPHGAYRRGDPERAHCHPGRPPDPSAGQRLPAQDLQSGTVRCAAGRPGAGEPSASHQPRAGAAPPGLAADGGTGDQTRRAGGHLVSQPGGFARGHDGGAGAARSLRARHRQQAEARDAHSGGTRRRSAPASPSCSARSCCTSIRSRACCPPSAPARRWR